MVEIYAVRIDELVGQDVYQKLLSYVSEEEREQIKQFHFIKDAKRTLYAELLVRCLACERLKLVNRELVIACNEFGKTFLQGYPDFHFNISHSGNWAVCVISAKEVGVDIEKIKPIDFDIPSVRSAASDRRNIKVS
jgi:4'-phosphopantetheinyl transferase